MRLKKKSVTAVASVSIAAALASPTFGTLTFRTTESSVIITHDAEDGDLGGVSPTNFRSTGTLSGASIPKSSTPPFQLAEATVRQTGTSTAGTSQGKLGIGYYDDARTATMTVRSLSFVNQNEEETEAGLKMDGNSLLSANFTLVWQNNTTVYGPNIVGRMSIPVQATIVGGGSAKVQLTNVEWQVDFASDGFGNYFDARPDYTGELAFSGAGSYSGTLTSNSVILKNLDGTGLTLGTNDKLKVSGTLTFLADGNSPAGIQVGTDYQSLVLNHNPLRYYRFEESSTTQDADDIGTNNADGKYRGLVSVGHTSATGLGNAAYFSASDEVPSFIGEEFAASAVASGDVQAGTSGLVLENGPFTIEAWVNKGESFGTFDFESAPPPFRAIVDNQTPSGNGVTLGLLDNAILFGGDTDLIVPFVSNVGEFYHIVVVTDGLGNGTVYVNGIAVGTGSYLLGSGGASFLIGNAGNNLATQFVGLIDEVAIYRTALTSLEILSHYENGQDGGVLPLMGVELNELFVETPEPATATLAMLTFAAGSLTLGRRRTR